MTQLALPITPDFIRVKCCGWVSVIVTILYEQMLELVFCVKVGFVYQQRCQSGEVHMVKFEENGNKILAVDK